MNVHIITSGEAPNREYAFPNAEKRAATLLLTVMKRGGRRATMATVSSYVVAKGIASGHIAPDGWDVITAQRAL